MVLIRRSTDSFVDGRDKALVLVCILGTGGTGRQARHHMFMNEHTVEHAVVLSAMTHNGSFRIHNGITNFLCHRESGQLQFALELKVTKNQHGVP